MRVGRNFEDLIRGCLGIRWGEGRGGGGGGFISWGGGKLGGGVMVWPDCVLVGVRMQSGSRLQQTR